VEAELLRDPRITPQCKALYSLLITYGPRRIFPSQQTLGKCLGVSRQTVKTWLDELKALGLITWTPRNGSSNEYDILGYANLQPVKPTLQGCKAQLTPPVKPTLHDPDPLIQIQELERPSTDVDDFSDLFDKPNGKPITTNLPATAQDPIELAAKTQEARAKEKQWTTPQANADSWADKPLHGFCVLATRPELKESERKNWPRQLQKWAREWKATPDECYQCIKAIPDSEFHWMTFRSPFSNSFLEIMDAMISRIRAGQPINAKGNGHQPAALPQEQQDLMDAFIKQKNAQVAAKFGFEPA
jgi:hypothetical protein